MNAAAVARAETAAAARRRCRQFVAARCSHLWSRRLVQPTGLPAGTCLADSHNSASPSDSSAPDRPWLTTATSLGNDDRLTDMALRYALSRSFSWWYRRATGNDEYVSSLEEFLCSRPSSSLWVYNQEGVPPTDSTRSSLSAGDQRMHDQEGVRLADGSPQSVPKQPPSKAYPKPLRTCSCRL